MGRLRGVLVLAVAWIAATAPPAAATFHLNKVNEVMLAGANGDAGVQFVELYDANAELFPLAYAPYRLTIYNADGTLQGSPIALTNTALATASAAQRPFLVGTAAADTTFAVTSDAALTVTLPGEGQACFSGTPLGVPTTVSCLTWGTITSPIPAAAAPGGSGSVNTPSAPPPGASAQRQADDTIAILGPTPKAANASPAVPPVAGGGGTTPPPGGGQTPTPTAMRTFAGAAFPGRTASVTRSGRALVRLRCPGSTEGRCHGRLTLRSAGRTIGTASVSIRAAQTATVGVRLTRASRRRLARAGRLAVTARAALRDSAGRARTTTARLTLKRS